MYITQPSWAQKSVQSASGLGMGHHFVHCRQQNVLSHLYRQTSSNACVSMRWKQGEDALVQTKWSWSHSFFLHTLLHCGRKIVMFLQCDVITSGRGGCAEFGLPYGHGEALKVTWGKNKFLLVNKSAIGFCIREPSLYCTEPSELYRFLEYFLSHTSQGEYINTGKRKRKQSALALGRSNLNV